MIASILLRSVRIGSLLLLAAILAICLYRVPQALLSRFFPNDYVYRYTASATFEGNTYAGDTIGGCRNTRDAWPDWARLPSMGVPYTTRVWATALNIDLPNRQFLLLPMDACGPTSFQPDPGWKVALGLLYGRHPVRDSFDAIEPFKGRDLFLFDDDVDPKGYIAILSRHGAETLRFSFSRVTISPASWSEVENNLARGPRAPWLAPAMEACFREGVGKCLGGAAETYIARRYTVGEAMQAPEFEAWAARAERTEDRSSLDVSFPYRSIEKRHQKRDYVALRPDWSTFSWQLSETPASDVRYVVSLRWWKGDMRAPVICVTSDRCSNIGGARGFVDWRTGDVIVLQHSGAPLHGLLSRGEFP